MSLSRTTQSDIARKAGVHRSTVSMALRDHPRIPVATRKRILAIAKELGYSPDPMLTALAAYRDRQRPAIYHGTLAWLTASTATFNWSESRHYSHYFSGAQAAARKFGYQMEVFDLSSPNFSPKLLKSIFRARNITGIFVCPHPTGYAGIDFSWNDFSLITFGYSVSSPRMHTIASAHYRNTQNAMKKLAQRGYRRPGLVLNQDTEVGEDRSILAAYLSEQYKLTGEQMIPPFYEIRSNPDAFWDWLKKYDIDVILTLNYLLPFFKKWNIPYGEELKDIGFVNLTLSLAHDAYAGILEDSEGIGRVAANFLISMIQRGERGIPDSPLITLLDGSWNEGTTLPGCG